MAKYNLHEILKERGMRARSTDGEIALDDVSRVKVLSPGRQVFKRFMRNRLAVFGACLLIAMFVFAFLGPLVYAYGQKEIFYKYDAQNVQYGVAKENTTYNGYDLGEGAGLSRTVTTAMNTNLKRMEQDGSEARLVITDDGTFVLTKLADLIYTLSPAEAQKVASAGSGSVRVGTYSTIVSDINYEITPVDGLAEACKKNIGKTADSGEFVFDGVTYKFTKGEAKSYVITAEYEGVIYTGASIGSAFESAVDAVVGESSSFESGGKLYALVENGSRYDVYEVKSGDAVRVYTRYTVDTFETGKDVGDEFRAAALEAVATDGTFSEGNSTYTIADEDDLLIVRDASGNEFAEFSTFTVRRYSGEDSMEYGLKKALSEAVTEMLEEGKKTTVLNYRIPSQNENGEYTTDEDGNLVYQEAALTITQRDISGSDASLSYVITCDQIIYLIDRYASPTPAHIFGTDGDGFDVLARIMYGGRVSLMVGFVVVFLEIFLGVIMGGLAGYYGKWVDNLIMRLVDIFYCLPSTPIMIILGAMMDAQRMDTYMRLFIMMAALGLMGWAGVARLVRGQILSLREQEFMVATEATGIKVKDRIFHHLVPNVMPQLIVIATSGMGGVIITESTLSYLGLGVKHPLATWGTMINSVSSASAMAQYPYIWIPVGLLICLTVIAFNFVGDGLRDAYDPKGKR